MTLKIKLDNELVYQAALVDPIHHQPPPRTTKERKLNCAPLHAMMIYELLFPQEEEKEKFKLWKLSEEEKICFKTFAYSRISVSISPGDGL